MSMPPEDDDDGGGRSRAMSITGIVLPLVTAGAALLVGVGVGALGAWMLKPAVTVEKMVPRDYTAAEMTSACQPLVAAEAAKVEAANNKVNDLVTTVKDREARVKELEAQAKKGAQWAAGVKKDLADARSELAQAKTELQTALREKEQIVYQLQKTLGDLEVQKQATHEAKEDSLSNKWTAFVNQSQLDVCEKGNRKKLGKCREKVVTVLDAATEQKYGHCIRSGQEAPSLKEAAKGEALPMFAQWMDQEDKITKDWYILLCDPALPEAEGFATVGPPTTHPTDGPLTDSPEDAPLEKPKDPSTGDKSALSGDDVDLPDDLDGTDPKKKGK